MELAVDKHAKLAEILALQNKKLNSRKRRLFNKNIKLKKLLETCSRCEHNLLNSKTNLE